MRQRNLTLYLHSRTAQAKTSRAGLQQTRRQERKRGVFFFIYYATVRAEETVGLTYGMCAMFASQAWSAVHTRGLVLFRIVLCSVCTCVRVGLAAANLGVTCWTPEQGCGSGAGLDGHVITKCFAPSVPWETESWFVLTIRVESKYVSEARTVNIPVTSRQKCRFGAVKASSSSLFTLWLLTLGEAF